MSEGPGTETHATAHSRNGASAQDLAGERADAAAKRTLLFFVLTGACAAAAFFIVRAALARRPPDPTTERIQQLIDEANRLLKQLDEKQPGR